MFDVPSYQVSYSLPFYPELVGYHRRQHQRLHVVFVTPAVECLANVQRLLPCAELDFLRPARPINRRELADPACAAVKLVNMRCQPSLIKPLGQAVLPLFFASLRRCARRALGKWGQWGNGGEMVGKWWGNGVSGGEMGSGCKS